MKRSLYLLPLAVLFASAGYITADDRSCCSQETSILSRLFSKPKPSTNNSIIVYPRKEIPVPTTTPILAGLVRNNKNNPLKNHVVNVYVDGKLIGNATTNNNGAWSYKITASQALTNGCHTVAAASAKYGTFLKDTPFTVANRSVNMTSEIYRSGNADATYSLIGYPYQDAFVNSTTPPIVGFINDANNNPVENETVTIKVDNVTVQTVSSDFNGLFSYILDENQALNEGTHSLDVYANESDVNLQGLSFTVDVTPPAAPVITSPAQNGQVNSNTVIMTGTCEPWAMVTVFIDNDTDGQIAYSDGDGAWTLETFLANGSHTANANAQDIAFNYGPVSGNVTFNVN